MRLSLETLLRGTPDVLVSTTASGSRWRLTSTGVVLAPPP